MIGDRPAISDTTSQPLGGSAVDQVGDDLDESGGRPRAVARGVNALSRRRHKHGHADRARTHVYRQHRTHVGHGERLDLRQPRASTRRRVRRRRRGCRRGAPRRRAAIADDLGDPIDHRRVRLGDGADPLVQHQPAVDVETQQRLQRQRGAQPGRGAADPAAAPQVVQPVHHDERVAPRARADRAAASTASRSAPRGRGTRRGQRDEAGAHRRRPRVDHPHRRGRTRGRLRRRRCTCSTARPKMCTATTPSPPLSASACR